MSTARHRHHEIDYIEFGVTDMATAQSDVTAGGPLVILYSDDLEGTLARVRNAGGQISQEIFAIPGGRRFHFEDPSGNEPAVWSDR